jgi:hypothetical protein
MKKEAFLFGSKTLLPSQMEVLRPIEMQVPPPLIKMKVLPCPTQVPPTRMTAAPSALTVPLFLQVHQLTSISVNQSIDDIR